MCVRARACMNDKGNRKQTASMIISIKGNKGFPQEWPLTITGLTLKESGKGVKKAGRLLNIPFIHSPPYQYDSH